ncbi:MAG: phage protease [Limisphaerales bacterium]
MADKKEFQGSTESRPTAEDGSAGTPRPTAQEELILARAMGVDVTALPGEFMYMPAGDHEINASRAGRPVSVRVHIDRGTAEALQQSLEAHSSETPHRPFFDFDHDNNKASAWPRKFFWRDTGVFVAVEWTKSGAEAVQGKDYRAFSPSFFVDAKDPAHVTGAPLDMGGLVNNPAFKNILPLWAKNQETEKPKTNVMTEQELAALQAKLQKLEQENQELKAKAASSDSADAIQAKDKQITDITAQLNTAREAIQARRKADAEAAVNAAVARGAIAPKNEVIRAKWQTMIEADPTNAELLAAMPDNPALAPVIPKAAASGALVQVTRESYKDVLRGYISAKTPRERGHVYRKELDARLAAGERIPMDAFPIDAANSFGTLVGNIISQRTLSLIFSRRPALTAFVNDFSDQPAAYNQEIITRTVGLPSLAAFGAASTDTADTDYPVTLDQLKQVQFEFAATDYAATHRDLIKEHSDALAFALGNALMDAVAALITSAFTAKTTKASASVNYTDIITQTTVLNKAGAPDGARVAMVNADVAQSMRNDEIVMANFNRNNSSAYAHWQNLEGFNDIWEYPALPTNLQNLTGFFAHRDALILAARVLTDPTTLIGAGYPGKLAVVTDPVNGLSVLSNQYIDQATLKIVDRLIVLYGASRGNLVCGATLVSA